MWVHCSPEKTPYHCIALWTMLPARVLEGPYNSLKHHVTPPLWNMNSASKATRLWQDVDQTSIGQEWKRGYTQNSVQWAAMACNIHCTIHLVRRWYFLQCRLTSCQAQQLQWMAASVMERTASAYSIMARLWAQWCNEIGVITKDYLFSWVGPPGHACMYTSKTNLIHFPKCV